MVNDVLRNIEKQMQTSIVAFKNDLATIRTGHASPALIEHIKVEYAGVPTPLNQIASISAPEARLLVIHPWDKNTVSEIQKTILKSDLGLNPSADGNVIRISIPPLSEERRRELIKVVGKRTEERRIAIRSLRHEAMEELRKLEKDKAISQDDFKRAQEQLQKLTDLFMLDIQEISQDKEAKLMEV